MNRRTRLLAAAAVVVTILAATSSTVRAGNQEVREIVLLRGGNTSAAVDTAELVSPWFSIKGAVRVYIRTWSANTSAWTAADSIYADSLTTFKVLLSDSICCQVTGPTGLTIPSAADSVVWDPTLAQTTSDSTLWAKSLPINKALAAAKNGSGITTVIYIPTPGLAGNAADFTGIFPKQYMRIRTQALRRLTEGGRLSTAGIRTQGIRGLRMRAYLYYPNK